MTTIRDHFVYTAYDIDDRVLYVGCTKNLDERKKAHRSGSDWFRLATRFHLRGPFDRKAGRQVERERLALDRPLYAFHPKRRTLIAIYNRIANSEMDRLTAGGMDRDATVGPAYDLATSLTGYQNNRSPIDITDDVLRLAFHREREYAKSIARRTAA